MSLEEAPVVATGAFSHLKHMLFQVHFKHRG